MRNVWRMRRLCLVALLIAGATSTTATAQEQSATEDLPSAEKVIDAFIAAIGGKKAVADIESCRATLALKAGSQPEMDFHTLWHRDGAFQIRYARNNMEYRAGCDGNIAWIFDTASRFKLLPPEGAARVEEQASMPTMLFTLEKRYADMKVLGTTTYFGRPCYELMLTDHDGMTRSAMFDRETAFLLGMKWEEESHLGPVPHELIFENWQEVGSVMMWHKLTMRKRTAQSDLYVSLVEFNKTAPADFELPAEVKALVAKQPGPEAPKPADPTAKP